VTLPAARVKALLMKDCPHTIFTDHASVLLTGVLDYLLVEVIGLAGRRSGPSSVSQAKNQEGKEPGRYLNKKLLVLV
jgi:hypothetical protein